MAMATVASTFKALASVNNERRDAEICAELRCTLGVRDTSDSGLEIASPSHGPAGSSTAEAVGRIGRCWEVSARLSC
jgi:hypothetical protein